MKKILALVLLLGLLLGLCACAKTCENCNGEGIVTCKTCKGEGTVKCKNCSGGQITCKTCSGKGSLTCKTCKGDTFVKTKERCDGCKDSKKPGYIYDSAQALKDWYNGKMTDANDSKYWKECSKCHGLGYKTETCPDCKGSGLGASCDACSGTGKLVCPTCGGTQIVTCSECGGATTVTCPECGGEGKVEK